MSLPTTITLVTSPNPSAMNQEIRIRATATSEEIRGRPSGIITLDLGNITWSAIITVSTGSAEFFTTMDASKIITATYGGDNIFGSSVSKPVTHYVIKPQLVEIIPSGGNTQYAGIMTNYDLVLSSSIFIGPSYSPPFSGSVTFHSPTTGPSCLFENGSHTQTIEFDEVIDNEMNVDSSILTSNMVTGTYGVNVRIDFDGDIPSAENNFILTNIIQYLGPGTQILMLDNTWKAVSDVKEGEWVAGDSEPQCVVKNEGVVAPWSNLDMIEFKVGSLGFNIPNQPLLVSPEYMMLLDGKKYKAKYFQEDPNVTRYAGGNVLKEAPFNYPFLESPIKSSDKCTLFWFVVALGSAFNANGIFLK